MHNANGLPADGESNDGLKGIRDGSSNKIEDQKDTQVIFNSEEIQKLSTSFALESSREILLSVMSEEIITQHLEGLVELPTILKQRLKEAQRESSGIPRIKYLVPIASQSAFNNVSKAMDAVEWRALEPTSGVTFAVYDRNKAIIFQFQENALSSAIVTTNRWTVLGLVSTFDALWRASELIQSHEKDRRLRKESQLLQDILTHDVKNHIQVVRLCAELLCDRAQQDEEALSLILQLTKSVDGTIDLLDSARKLGRIMSKENPELVPTDVSLVIRSAFDLIQRTASRRAIILEDMTPNNFAIGNDDPPPFHVYADDMLGEVFANLFSNSVRYTETGTVSLSIKIEDDAKNPNFETISHPDHQQSSHQGGFQKYESTKQASYLKISVSDRGKGIPDNMKELIFSRYLSSARGSGLGLSIVHALVVDRYRGKIRVIDRVPGDYTQGATVEIWLPKATYGM